jgi:hypothetical protein
MRTLHTHHKLPIRKFIIDAIAATIYWVVVMTPFMLLANPSWLPVRIFVEMNREQYLSWLTIEIIITPILGVLSVYFIRKFERYFRNRSGKAS